MWSGPRNISTAMMRSWGNRPDTFVCDEPLYAHYLNQTALPHPGADEIIARYETDWRKVVAWLTGPVPEDRSIFFQKQMAHHLLPEIRRDWLSRLSHVFLIRDPREILLSYTKKIENPTLADTGLPQQVEIFELVQKMTETTPRVLDARDVLENPRAMLEALCSSVGVEFCEEMLSWPPGRRATDGIWAKYWYHEVERSTSFRPFRPKTESLPARLEALHEQCREYYDALYRARLVV